MKKKIIRSLLTIGIISLVFIYTLSVVIVESPTDEIIDFSNFTIYHDSSLVTSVNMIHTYQ